MVSALKLLGSRFFFIRIVQAVRDNNIDFGVNASETYYFMCQINLNINIL
ncbi:hypothetical protein [Agathobacter sp.]